MCRRGFFFLIVSPLFFYFLPLSLGSFFTFFFRRKEISFFTPTSAENRIKFSPHRQPFDRCAHVVYDVHVVFQCRMGSSYIHHRITQDARVTLTVDPFRCCNTDNSVWRSRFTTKKWNDYDDNNNNYYRENTVSIKFSVPIDVDVTPIGTARRIRRTMHWSFTAVFYSVMFPYTQIMLLYLCNTL